MSLPAQRLPEAQAPNGLGLFIWWQPARIAVYQRGWRTISYPHYTANSELVKHDTKAISPSPIGVDGKAYYVGFDCDNGLEQVKKLLAALPPGCVPLVSRSGGRNGQGFHVWLFLAEPVAVKVAVSFAKAVREKAGVLCEIRPTGPNSLCVKWPGQKHPETGKPGLFVPLDDLDDTERLDTPLILQMLAEGYYRTPAAVVEAHATCCNILRQAAKSRGRPVGDASADICRTPPGIPREIPGEPVIPRETPRGPVGNLPDGAKLVRSLDELARREELVRELMRMAGRKPVRLGQGFKCILPGHEERHPSGSFFRAKSGHLLYGDFHARDGEATYTLGEVYHALATGKVAKLKPCDKARWLAMLGLRCGFATELVLRQREKHAAAILLQLQQNKNLSTGYENSIHSHENLPTTRGYYSTGCSPKGDWLVVLKVQEAVTEEAEIQAMGGFEEISLSARFLARRAKVKVELANKAVNLLCCLGLLDKVPGSGGMKGDRFTLAEVDAEEVRRRFELLFPDGQVNLRQFKRELVAATLGEDVAAAIFRRGPEPPTNSEELRQSAKISDNQRRTASRMPPNPFAEAIRQAELEGNRARAMALLRGLVAWVKAGRPPNVEAYLAGASP